MQSIPLNQSADLGALDAFLASDQVPDDCMTLSELDGFLAGIIAGPGLVMPSEWLNRIWGEGEPAFADLNEANAVLGHIMRHYNQIIRQLDAKPPAYHPILTETEDGKVDGSDWAVGFIAAIGLRQEDWGALACDPLTSMLLAPIMMVASTTRKANLPLDDDEKLPPEEMEKLLVQPGELLAMCTATIRKFFMESLGQAPRRRRSPSRKRPATGKRRRTH